MGLLDNMPDDGLANGATNFLGALGAGLLSGNRFQPIGPGFNQYMAQANRNASEQGDRASIAALLKLYGFSDEDAARLSGNRQAAELAIAKKQQDANTAATSAAISGAPSLFGGEGGGAAPRVSPAAPGGPAAGASMNGGGGSVTPPPEMASLFNAKEQQYGLPAGTLAGMADIETGGTFNPGAHNKGSGADGLFQFIPGTAKEYGVNTRDIASSTDGAARYARDNADRFRKEMGRDPTAAELYLMHQQGGGGGLALLRNPNAPAGSLVDPRNIASNGGDPNAPASAFISKWTNRFRGGTPPVQTADASGRIGAPPAAGDGSAIQTELGPVAFTPSAVPQDPGTDTRGDGRPADAAGVNAARRDYFRGGVPPVGSGVTPPPPPPPKPLPGARRSVDVAETEDDVRRLEGSVTGPADIPAPGSREAGFYVPGANGQPGRTYTGTSARIMEDREARAQERAVSSAPPTPEAVRGETSRRAAALRHYGYWSGQLARAGSNKPLAEYAKAQLDLSKEFLKPDQIEAKLDAAGITGPERQDIIRRSFSDNRPADVQRYEYGQANPGFAEYEARQGAGSSKIAADIEARKAAAAEMGLRPDSPEYRSFTLTGKFPREDQQPLSATDKKAILEADEGVLGGQAVIDNLRQAKTLSKKAYEGPAASWRGYGTSFLGSEAGQATLDLDNLVTTNALGQLKSIFGAAPTEGERKILLDIQGSSSLPDAARQKIYDRAIVAAERRLEFNRQRAADLRGQTYYKPQGGAGEGRGGSVGQVRQPQGAAPFSRPDLEAEARRRGLIQ